MARHLTDWPPKVDRFLVLRTTWGEMSSRLFLAALVCFCLVGADFPGFRARTRGGLKVNLRSAALIAPTAWAAEPERPALVDASRLAHALREVCGFMPSGRAERYAGLLLESSMRHGEDPFL